MYYSLCLCTEQGYRESDFTNVRRTSPYCSTLYIYKRGPHSIVFLHQTLAKFHQWDHPDLGTNTHTGEVFFKFLIFDQYLAESCERYKYAHFTI